MKLCDYYDTVLIREDPATGGVVPECVDGLQHVEGVRRAVGRCQVLLGGIRESHQSTSQGYGVDGAPDSTSPLPMNPRNKLTSHQLTQWADQILASGGMQPLPTRQQAMDVKLRRILQLLDEYDRMMTLAASLSSYQLAFLHTGNWMDKCVLTYLEVGRQHPRWDESTCRRTIQAMHIRIGHRVIAADELICASELPQICKLLVQIRREYPDVGAPTLRTLLQENGMEVSQRNVGKALIVLREWRRRQLN